MFIWLPRSLKYFDLELDTRTSTLKLPAAIFPVSTEALRARARGRTFKCIIGFTTRTCNGNAITQLALIFN